MRIYNNTKHKNCCVRLGNMIFRREIFFRRVYPVENMPYNVHFLALKVSLLCLLTFVCDTYITDNPDPVTTVLIGILLISPSPVVGVRNAWRTAFGIAIGTFWGCLFLVCVEYLSFRPLLPLFLTGVLTIYTISFLRRSEYYLVALYSALSLLLNPFGLSVFVILFVRGVAVATAFAAAMVVNTADTLLFLKITIKHRSKVVGKTVFAKLGAAIISCRETEYEQVFGMLNELKVEFLMAKSEIRHYDWISLFSLSSKELLKGLRRSMYLKYLLELELQATRIIEETGGETQKQLLKQMTLDFFNYVKDKRDWINYEFPSDRVPEALHSVLVRMKNTLEMLQEEKGTEGGDGNHFGRFGNESTILDEGTRMVAFERMLEPSAIGL